MQSKKTGIYASNLRAKRRAGFLNPDNSNLILFYEGKLAELRNDWKKAKTVFASLSSNPTAEKIIKRRSLIRLGNAMWMLDELPKAESTYLKVLEIKSASTDGVELANVYCNLAKLYQKIGQFYKAKQYAIKG